jgi:hypothetical protein
MASTANAGGIGLRWGSCEGTANRNFACTGSSGSELLVGSFNPPKDISQLVGIQVYIRITGPDGDAPSWWQMYEPGACRRYSIQASFDVSDQTECDDPWSGQASGGFGKFHAEGNSGIDILMAAAVPPSAITSVRGGTTYAAFKLLVNHQKTGGAGGCAGCETPVCISFEAIRLVQPSRRLHPNDPIDNSTEDVYTEVTSGIGGMGGQSQVATWQGGTSTCGAGLAKPATWGELKSRFKAK